MKKTNNKGFTFIELVLYMGIISIFMVAVSNLTASVVNSDRKVSTTTKVQSQASETYEAISDMLMSAVDVKIVGNASVYQSDSYVKKDGVFIIPDSSYVKGDNGILKTSGDVYITEKLSIASSASSASTGTPMSGTGYYCYDIADIKSFGDVTSPSTDTSTYIKANASGELYLYIKYASDVDSSTGETLYTCCTIKYVDADDMLYVYKCDSTASEASCFVDASSATNSSGMKDSVLCKYVKDFKLQINPDEQSFCIMLDLEDTDTASSYSVNNVVSLRNSYVIKAHTWD